MKYDVNDLTDTQINFLVAKAQGYEAIDHLTWVELIPNEEVSYDDYQDTIAYDPTTDWDCAGGLLDIYKPYISSSKNGVVVEILDEVSSVKSKLGIKYATAKHPDDIKIALCRAVVAYHYGYEIEM